MCRVSLPILVQNIGPGGGDVMEKEKFRAIISHVDHLRLFNIPKNLFPMDQQVNLIDFAPIATKYNISTNFEYAESIADQKVIFKTK